MVLSNTLKDIFVSSPRNIKRRLLRDILLILLFTITGIVSLTFIEGKNVKNEVSTKIISDTVTLIRDQVMDFTRPVEKNLQIISQWGKLEKLSLESPDPTIELLTPILKVYKEISTLSIVDNHGKRLLLTKNDSIIDSTLNKKLSQPLTTLPWYDGALSQPAAQPVHWSRIFIDPHLQEKAITASIAWHFADGSVAGVAAFTISVKNLLLLIDDLQIPQELEILFLSKNGMVFSKNNTILSSASLPDEESNSYEAAGEYAVQYWQDNNHQASSSVYFRIGTKGWWAGFSQLRSGSDINWLSVIMPESLIMEDVQSRWMNILLIASIIFLAGFIMTIFLVRKYSSQLKDLPQQSIKQSSFIDDINKLVEAGESSNIEFKSTIRTNLQTGKTGKEIEFAWLKTITAFMNSDGGTLLIGINDDGIVSGIESDNFKNHDKCFLHCKNLITTHIGAEFTRYIHIKIGNIEGKDVVSMECERVRKPVFMKVGKNEDFYIRSGPSSIKLSMSQLVKYLNER